MEVEHRPKQSTSVTELKKSTEGSSTRDDIDLMRLGKKPALKRNLGFVAALGFSCTVLITWEGIIVVSTSGLLNGGPAGLIWGYLVVWIGSISTFLVQSELVSMAPIAGGQYHWVAMVAPESSRKFFSYISGLLTVAGWQVGTSSAAYLIATILQGIIIATDSGYQPKPWQALILTWAVLVVCIIINIVGGKVLAKFEGLILFLHIFGFFAVLIPLLYLSPKANASFVFTTFVNTGGWSSMGLSFLVGMPAAVYSLLSADSAVHLSEEIHNASVTVPRVIIITVLLNGAMGFGMIMSYLFCIQDLEATLASAGSYGYPFLYVFLNGTGSAAGAAAMAIVIFVMAVCSTVGIVAAASRILWSFARDKGTPFPDRLVKLNKHTSIPLNTVLVTIAVSVILSFITLGSSVAFTNVVSLTIGTLYGSFLISSLLLLYRRTRTSLHHSIQPYNPRHSFTAHGNLQWGPFYIPGWLGTANNAFAVVYLAFVFFWTFWPPVTPVSRETMNWSCVTFGGALLGSVGWYFVKVRKVYQCPVVSIRGQSVLGPACEGANQNMLWWKALYLKIQDK